MSRTTDAKPGSAWDTWHKAGYDFASAGGSMVGIDLDVAACSYAATRGFWISTVEAAFKEGALNYLRTGGPDT